jgi:hypothetical protein
MDRNLRDTLREIGDVRAHARLRNLVGSYRPAVSGAQGFDNLGI